MLIFQQIAQQWYFKNTYYFGSYLLPRGYLKMGMAICNKYLLHAWKEGR